MAGCIKIDSLDLPELDVYARLNETQLNHYYEPEPGIFIAESPLVIERALDAGYEPLSLLMETAHVTGQAKKLLECCGDIPVYIGEADLLAQLTGFKLIRGALCAMRRKSLPTVSDVCQDARRIVVLENVQNPTNIGAIFRSAAALSMDAVLLTPDCSNPLYRRAIRVSMGTVFQIPWTITDNWVEQLRALDFAMAAMALNDNSIGIDDERLMREEKLAVVMGSEGMGLCEDTINACDYVCKIPMAHGVDSLNVAAASAVVFWEMGKM